MIGMMLSTIEKSWNRWTKTKLKIFTMSKRKLKHKSWLFGLFWLSQNIYFIWKFLRTEEEEAGTSKDSTKIFVQNEEVLQKLLHTRGDVIEHCHENVITLKKKELSDDEKLNAQLYYENDAFQLEPVRISREKSRKNKAKYT